MGYEEAEAEAEGTSYSELDECRLRFPQLGLSSS